LRSITSLDLLEAFGLYSKPVHEVSASSESIKIPDNSTREASPSNTGTFNTLVSTTTISIIEDPTAISKTQELLVEQPNNDDANIDIKQEGISEPKTDNSLPLVPEPLNQSTLNEVMLGKDGDLKSSEDFLGETDADTSSTELPSSERYEEEFDNDAEQTKGEDLETAQDLLPIEVIKSDHDEHDYQDEEFA